MKFIWKPAVAAACGVAVLCGGALLAQSGSSVSMLFWDQISLRGLTTGNFLVGFVGGRPVPIQLGSNVSINTSTNPPTLTIATTSGPTPQAESYTYAAAATSQSLKFTPVSTVPMLVTRNGLVLIQNIDYTVSGAVVAFSTTGTPNNAPQPGDIFSFYYSH